MKKKSASNSIVVNRRARFDYQLGEELVCGMSLSGQEVRQIRDHHVQLKGSFVTLRKGELWLNNLTLGSETIRNIRLLVTKKQLRDFARVKQDGYTIVPTKLLGNERFIKLVVAVARGKKKYDKRQNIKERDIERGRY